MQSSGIVSETITFASTINPELNALTGRIMYYKRARSPMPVLMLMHQFTGAYTDLDIGYLIRLARRRIFVVAINMRGHGTDAGAPDASGREVYDIYDALQYVRTTYPTLASPDYAAIAGCSGGGGNTFACIAKFPDAWTVAAEYSGMSDYETWHDTAAAGAKSTVETRVGGTPAAVPNNYKARDHRDAAKNFSGGFLYMYHDPTDAIVNVAQSQMVDAILTGLGRTNYAVKYLAYGHGLGFGGYFQDSLVAKEETDWAGAVASKTHAVWTIPDTGTVVVSGYIKTKRFTIWLGDGTAAAATIAYNTTTDSYTITPITTGDIAVVITQGTKTASQTINSETTLIVA